MGFLKFCAFITALFGMLATAVLVIGIGASNGAPQQAAVAAIAAAMVIIPYTFTKCVEILAKTQQK